MESAARTGVLRRALGIARRLVPEKHDGVGCRCCGDCCRRYTTVLMVNEADVKRWRAEGRADLLSRVGPRGDIWFDPITGARERSCPFLTRIESGLVLCGIQDSKPEICRSYPGAVQGFRCLRGVCFPLAPYWSVDRIILA